MKFGFLIPVLCLISVCSSAQTSWKYTYSTNRDAQMIGVGVEDTKLFKMPAKGKSLDIAVMNAKRDAVAVCLFKGIEGGVYEKAVLRLCDEDAMQQYADFFQSFFQYDEKKGLTGDFNNYVSCTRIPSGKDCVKVKNRYEIYATVKVSYENLRKLLEKKGIIKPLDEIADSKKPAIMIFPNKSLFEKMGSCYYDNEGVRIYDYEKFLGSAGSEDFRCALSQFSRALGIRNFNPVDLQKSLESLNQQKIIDEYLQSSSGSFIKKELIDYLNQSVKADILLDFDYSISTSQSGEKQASIIVVAVDAYSNKRLANISAVGRSSLYGTPCIMLKEVINNSIDDFTRQLHDEFNEIMEKGREVVVKFALFESSDVNFSTEFELNGESVMLSEIIDGWMYENCVNHSFNRLINSDNVLTYNPARMPLFKNVNGKERAMDSKGFVMDLKKYLEENFNIHTKLIYKGLGEVEIVIM